MLCLALIVFAFAVLLWLCDSNQQLRYTIFSVPVALPTRRLTRESVLAASPLTPRVYPNVSLVLRDIVKKAINFLGFSELLPK